MTRTSTHLKVLILLLRQRLLCHHEHPQPFPGHVSTLRSRPRSAGAAPRAHEALTPRGGQGCGGGYWSTGPPKASLSAELLGGPKLKSRQ